MNHCAPVSVCGRIFFFTPLPLFFSPLQPPSAVGILGCQVGLRWGNKSQKEKERGSQRGAHLLPHPSIKGETHTAFLRRRVIGARKFLGQPAKAVYTCTRVHKPKHIHTRAHCCREIYASKQKAPNKDTIWSGFPGDSESWGSLFLHSVCPRTCLSLWLSVFLNVKTSRETSCYVPHGGRFVDKSRVVKVSDVNRSSLK